MRVKNILSFRAFMKSFLEIHLKMLKLFQLFISHSDTVNPGVK